MPKGSKICIELPFNRTVSYSQRLKTKEFWHVLDNDTNLKPYEIPSEQNDTRDTDADQLFPFRIKGMWHDQFKVFQEHGLDKAALAGYESCKMCSTKFFPGPSSYTESTEEPYEELQRGMQAFDKKLNAKKKNGTKATKRSSSTQ